MIVLLVIETDLSWLWSIHITHYTVHSTQYTSYNPHLAWLRLASTEDSRSTHQHTPLPSITQQRLTGGRGGGETRPEVRRTIEHFLWQKFARERKKSKNFLFRKNMTIFKNWFFANVYEIFVKLFLFANSRDNPSYT